MRSLNTRETEDPLSPSIRNARYANRVFLFRFLRNRILVVEPKNISHRIPCRCSTQRNGDFAWAERENHQYLPTG